MACSFSVQADRETEVAGHGHSPSPPVLWAGRTQHLLLENGLLAREAAQWVGSPHFVTEALSPVSDWSTQPTAMQGGSYVPQSTLSPPYFSSLSMHVLVGKASGALLERLPSPFPLQPTWLHQKGHNNLVEISLFLHRKTLMKIRAFPAKTTGDTESCLI